MQKSYEGIEQCFYRVSAKAIIKNREGKILLGKTDIGYWDIPGGGIDHGENIHDALRREVMEEMGFSVNNISPQPIYTVNTETSGISYPKRPICLLVFSAEVDHLDFIPSDECIEIGFFSYEEALKIQLFPSILSIIEQIKKEA